MSTSTGGVNVNRSENNEACHAIGPSQGSLGSITAAVSPAATATVIAPSQYQIHPAQTSSSSFPSSSPFESSSPSQATSGTQHFTQSTTPKALQAALPLNNSSLSGHGRSLEGDGKRGEDADTDSIRMSEGAVDAAATAVTVVEGMKVMQDTSLLSPPTATAGSTAVGVGAVAGGGLGAVVGGVGGGVGGLGAVVGGAGGGNKGVYRRSSNPRKKSDDPSLCLFRPEEPSPRDCNSPSTSPHINLHYLNHLDCLPCMTVLLFFV